MAQRRPLGRCRRSRWIALLVLSAVSAACGTDPSGTSGTGGRARAPVVEIVDGDTIRVSLDGDPTSIRLIGVDTPETQGPFTQEECFGAEASRFTEDALAGREVELEFDVERTDRFGRTLAYVWVDGSLFNERIVRDGYAVLATFPPNVRYVDRLAAAQRDALGEQRGLWSGCPTRTE